MTCPSCVAIPLVLFGAGGVLSSRYSRYIILSLLLTIFPLCIYLHYKEFKKCEKCL